MEPPSTTVAASAVTPKANDATELEHIASASAEKVRVVSNDDRIKLMNLFKQGRITEDELVKRVGFNWSCYG